MWLARFWGVQKYLIGNRFWNRELNRKKQKKAKDIWKIRGKKPNKKISDVSTSYIKFTYQITWTFNQFSTYQRLRTAIKLKSKLNRIELNFNQRWLKQAFKYSVHFIAVLEEKNIQTKYWEFSENCKNAFVDDMPQTSTNCPEKKRIVAILNVK